MSHKLTIEDFKRHPIMRVTMASCNKAQLNCCVDVVNDIHYYEIIYNKIIQQPTSSNLEETIARYNDYVK